MTRSSVPTRSLSSRASSALVVALVAALVLPTAAHAILRSEIVARASVWTMAAVPYSQNGFARSDGTIVSSLSQGWRRDCSGFVSMALGLRTADERPLSLDTSTLDDVLIPISQEQLKPGDVILRSRLFPGAPYGHSIVFGGWTDATRTAYVGYEESSGRGRALSRVIPYPFWAPVSGFMPYRYQYALDKPLDPQPKKSRPKTAPAPR